MRKFIGMNKMWGRDMQIIPFKKILSPCVEPREDIGKECTLFNMYIFVFFILLLPKMVWYAFKEATNYLILKKEIGRKKSDLNSTFKSTANVLPYGLGILLINRYAHHVTL